jgi:integration host factor subunit beta
MTRSDLVLALHRRFPDLTTDNIECLVDTVFCGIGDALASDGRIELRGFGAFSVRCREPRVGRNPRTGEAVHVTSKCIPFFKPGKLLRDVVDGRDVLPPALHTAA